MTNSIVQHDIASLLDSWIDAERNGIEFPVPFDLAWGIAGYSMKHHGKRKLTAPNSQLTKGVDYITNSGESSPDGRSSDSIQLTCDGFKQFCLLAKTKEGKQIRQYFIESEKKWKLVQQVSPQVATEVDVLHLQIELATIEAKRLQAERELIGFRHSIVSMCPEPIQQKILGYKEIKTTEYVDRTILPSGQVNDGVGITYLQKRYGFKSTKEAWAVLDSVGCGKDSDVWIHQLKAVESSVIDRKILSDIDALVIDATRQRNIGEGLIFS